MHDPEQERDIDLDTLMGPGERGGGEQGLLQLPATRKITQHSALPGSIADSHGEYGEAGVASGQLDNDGNAAALQTGQLGEYEDFEDAKKVVDGDEGDYFEDGNELPVEGADEAEEGWEGEGEGEGDVNNAGSGASKLDAAPADPAGPTLTAAALQQHGARTAAGAGGAARGRPPVQLRVLVVDDSMVNRKITCKSLRKVEDTQHLKKVLQMLGPSILHAMYCVCHHRAQQSAMSWQHIDVVICF